MTTLHPALKGLTGASLAFIAFGTISALWPNPLFARMTPAGGIEIALLAALSGLFGLYLAIRVPACANKTAGTGGVLGFLGVACPVCNKILLYLFGGELLMAYFEPVRVYVAVAGIAVMGLAVFWAWRGRREMAAA